jgi:hypothetical protein
MLCESDNKLLYQIVLLIIMSESKLADFRRAFELLNFTFTFLEPPTTSLNTTPHTPLHSTDLPMSAASIFRAASRTRIAARSATVVRRPCRVLTPMNAVKSFSCSARTNKDHDPHDPHHEESFEEFTARYAHMLGGVCVAQWLVDGLMCYTRHFLLN